MVQANVLSAAAIGFLVGAFTASFVSINVVVLVGLAVLFLLGIAVFFRKEELRLALIASFFVLTGLFAYERASSAILQADVPYEGQNVSFEAVVSESPDERPDKTFLVLRSTDGSVDWLVRATVYKGDFSYGQYLRVEGVLQRPENFDGFDYRGWLAKEGIGYVMYEPRIEVTTQREGGVRARLAQVRRSVAEGVESMLPPPHSGLYRAMLLSERGSLPQQEQEVLRGGGLSHIVAISGMHIAILFGLVLALLLGIGLGRPIASYIALTLIAAYIIMIGAPASALRAGLMGAMLIGAERVGRPNSSWRALLLAGAVMVIANPLIIRHDVGFQLSFVAVAGILFGLPYRDRLLGFVPESIGIRSLLAMTLSAQLATLPLVLMHFGSAPWAGVIANMVVVPVLPFVLIVGMITALAGALGAGALFATPAWALSSYIFFVANLFV